MTAARGTKPLAAVREVEPAFVDKRGAAKLLAQSVRALDYARARGDLPFYRHHGKVCFAIRDLQTYMERFRVDVREA